MEKYVPLEKRSKKEQRAWHARQRGDWNGVKPVTRIVPSKKHYNRKKKRQEFSPDVFLCAVAAAPFPGEASEQIALNNRNTPQLPPSQGRDAHFEEGMTSSLLDR